MPMRARTEFMPSAGITVAESPLPSKGEAAEHAPDVVYVVEPDEYMGEWKKILQAADGSDTKATLGHAFSDHEEIAWPKFIGQATSSMLSELNRLRESFPNFAEFIDSVRAEVLRALFRKAQGLKGLKVLLVGPPGIGKTQVARAVANALGLPMKEIRVSSQSAGLEIAGSGRQWSNTTPGAIARAFSKSSYANPIIFLDEVDKGPAVADHHGRSIDALLQLAEPEDAKHFEDNCLRVTIDAHRAFVIATANDASLLPEPLRSRFDELAVSAPTSEQMPAIIATIYRQEIRDEQTLFSPTLPPTVLYRLSALTPRSAKIAIRNAVKNAVLRSELMLGQQRSPIEVQSEDLRLERDSGSRPFLGFRP